MAAKYRKIDPRIWVDEFGKKRRVSRPGILNPTRHHGHRHLRRFVFKRDGFTCQACGAVATADPETYTGRYTVYTEGQPLVLDHIVPRCAGGTNHPSNIQTLCERCNRTKGGIYVSHD